MTRANVQVFHVLLSVKRENNVDIQRQAERGMHAEKRGEARGKAMSLAEHISHLELGSRSKDVIVKSNAVEVFKTLQPYA